jgi:hypothetical protein
MREQTADAAGAAEATGLQATGLQATGLRAARAARATGEGAELRRPALKGGLRRLRRDEGTVQLGVDPGRAVLVTGLDEAGRRWMEGLDGSHEWPGLLRAAAAAGVPPEVAAGVLDVLSARGLLDDAAADRGSCAALSDLERRRLQPDLASLALVHGRPDGGWGTLGARLGARVEVHGGGRVGASAAALLVAAGVGTVHVTDHQPADLRDLAPAGLGRTDVGTARGTAATRAARRTSVARPAPPAKRGRPDLVLLATELPVPPAVRDELLGSGVPHLVAGVRETVGLVGPLVIPGRSSCLLCHDLTRTDRDPAWPRLAAQLTTDPCLGGRVLPCDIVLATAVASHASLQALAFLDGGRPSAVDGTLEIALPDGTVRRRSWQRHPACGCGWADVS